VSVSQQSGDGIGFTLGYTVMPDACCPPFDKTTMLEQLTLTQTGNVLGDITYGFLNSSPYNTQMQSYLDYLHSLNSAITYLSVGWYISDLGPGPGAPNTTGPAVPGSPAYTIWGAGGGGNLTFSTNKYVAGIGYPIIDLLQPNEWYGFGILITLPDGIQFWPATCSYFTATFLVYADPPEPDTSTGGRGPRRIVVAVREPGATSGRVVTLPLVLPGQEPRN
jgi:hypothetical protein